MMRDFLCLFLVPMIMGAEVLTVRVLDPSGAAVPKANITITHRATQETRSRIGSDSGESIFEELRPGAYIVQADAQGFGASEVEQVDIRSQGRSSVELTLDLARLTTHVQVTAAGTAQTVDEQSKALDVIDRDEIDRRLEYSVAEAVRAVAGMRVQQFGGPGSLVRILARGMRPSDTSVLVDGFRFRDAAAPQGDVSAFAGDLLIAGTSRIEVLRGSGSSLYGTHATGGIVNVITDQGGGAFRGE